MDINTIQSTKSSESIKATIPTWLLASENYIPKKDKEAFLRKTMLEILGKLSFLRSSASIKVSSKISVPGHLLGAILLAILVVTSAKLAFPIIVLCGFILYLAFLSGEKIISIFKPPFWAAILTLVIVLPSIFLGNTIIYYLPIKVFITVLIFSTLTRTIPMQKIIRALRYFRVPSMFILILDMTINYITLLGNTALMLLTSLKLRSVGKNKHKYQSFAGIMGMTFLKSQVYAQETYNAMVCRGFTGEYELPHNYKFSVNQLVYLAFYIVIFVLFFVFRGV